MPDEARPDSALHSESTVEIAGCTIRVMRGGKGAPLLYLHGASGAGPWSPMMARLAEHYDVIVPEHPGFGASDTPDWLDNIHDLAHFYVDFVRAFGLEKVHLVGLSLGGWIAAEMAVRDPSAMRSLVLVAPAGVSVPGVARNDIFLWSPEETAKNLFHDPAWAGRMPTPANDDEVMVALKNRMTTAKLGWSPRFHNPHLRKWLHRVTAPTLIVWGDDDKVLPPDFGPAYRDLIPGATLEVIPACGHLPHVEKAPEVAARTLSFLKGAA